MALKTRVLSLFAALFLLASSLCSCAGKTVLSFGNQTLSERLFSYALTLNKTKMLSEILGSNQNMTDDPAIWTTALDESGETYGDLLINRTLDTLKMTLFYCDYAKKNGITLSAEDEKSALANVNKVVSSFPSRKDFDTYMKKYGFDYELLCRYYTLDALSQAGMRAYYQNPKTSLTKADVRAYYEKEYLRAIYLFVNETDTTLANGKTVNLTEAEIAERKAFFDKAHDAILNGASFADYLKDSDTSSAFEAGQARTFLASKATPEELKKALLDAPVGTLSTHQGQKGRYLILREELDDAFFEENYEAMTLVLIAERETVILQENEASFVKNQAYFSSVDVANLAIF